MRVRAITLLQTCMVIGALTFTAASLTAEPRGAEQATCGVENNLRSPLPPCTCSPGGNQCITYCNTTGYPACAYQNGMTGVCAPW